VNYDDAYQYIYICSLYMSCFGTIELLAVDTCEIILSYVYTIDFVCRKIRKLLSKHIIGVK